MKKDRAKAMSEPGGDLRLLFATEAYSMGTDAPDIERIVHAGVPKCLESKYPYPISKSQNLTSHWLIPIQPSDYMYVLGIVWLVCMWRCYN